VVEGCVRERREQGKVGFKMEFEICSEVGSEEEEDRR